MILRLPSYANRKGNLNDLHIKTFRFVSETCASTNDYQQTTNINNYRKLADFLLSKALHKFPINEDNEQQCSAQYASGVSLNGSPLGFQQPQTKYR